MLEKTKFLDAIAFKHQSCPYKFTNLHLLKRSLVDTCWSFGNHLEQGGSHCFYFWVFRAFHVFFPFSTPSQCHLPNPTGIWPISWMSIFRERKEDDQSSMARHCCLRCRHRKWHLTDREDFTFEDISPAFLSTQNVFFFTGIFVNSNSLSWFVGIEPVLASNVGPMHKMSDIIIFHEIIFRVVKRWDVMRRYGKVWRGPRLIFRQELIWQAKEEQGWKQLWPTRPSWGWGLARGRWCTTSRWSQTWPFRFISFRSILLSYQV